MLGCEGSRREFSPNEAAVPVEGTALRLDHRRARNGIIEPDPHKQSVASHPHRLVGAPWLGDLRQQWLQLDEAACAAGVVTCGGARN